MRTSVERLDDLHVALTVEVDPPAVRRALDEAARHIAAEVEVPGFRKGRVPRRILESKLGKQTILQHAIDDHLPVFYLEALRVERLRAVGQPEIELERFDETEGARFTARVEVAPEFEAPDHRGIEVTFPEWEVDAAEVERYLEDLRERFAELEIVDRPAQRGDYVTLDLEVRVDGERVESLSVEDALYEVGSGGLVPRLDEELQGATAGSTLEFDDQLPEGIPDVGGRQAHFTVRVTDVRAKHLPALDDDFAATASEFDTIAELREDVRRTLTRHSIRRAEQRLRAAIVEAYLARIDIPLPPSLVQEEIEFDRRQLARAAEQAGMSVEEFLAAQGMDPEEYGRRLEAHAQATVKARLVLDRLAEQLGVEVTEEDLRAEILRHALTHGVPPDQLARTLQERGALGGLVADVRRRKAIDALVDAAVVEGAPDEDTLREVGLTEPPAAEQQQPSGGRLHVARSMADVQRAVADTDVPRS